MKHMGRMRWFDSAMDGIAAHDGHTWEILRNSAWRIDERGLVTFGL